MKYHRLAQLLCFVALGIFLVACNTSRTEEDDGHIQLVEPGHDNVSIVEEEGSLIEPAQPDGSSTVEDIPATQHHGPEIYAFIQTENGYEHVEYASREAFLQALDFDLASPFYECYDLDGHLIMELFFDEASKTGCGITHLRYGFDVQGVTSAEWEEPDKFSTASIHGDTGEDYYEIEDYEETLRVSEDGKPEYFYSQGNVTFLGGKQPQCLIEITFTYREDGTLQRKKYSHNQFVFETFSNTRDSYYDEQERLLYEDIYHTHGNQDCYYLYDSDSEKPVYALWLDLGAAKLIQYD